MQYLGIFTRHDYQDENNESQTRWYKAGYMKVTPQGGRFIKMFHLPETTYYAFETDTELPEIQAE